MMRAFLTGVAARIAQLAVDGFDANHRERVAA